MSESRNIHDFEEGCEPTTDERLLEALLAEMPRHKCPSHVRENVLAALKEEQCAGTPGGGDGGAPVIPVWFRRHSARLLQAAAILAFAVVGTEVYFDLRKSGDLDERAALFEHHKRYEGREAAAPSPPAEPEPERRPESVRLKSAKPPGLPELSPKSDVDDENAAHLSDLKVSDGNGVQDRPYQPKAWISGSSEPDSPARALKKLAEAKTELSETVVRTPAPRPTARPVPKATPATLSALKGAPTVDTGGRADEGLLDVQVAEEVQPKDVVELERTKNLLDESAGAARPGSGAAQTQGAEAVAGKAAGAGGAPGPAVGPAGAPKEAADQIVANQEGEDSRGVKLRAGVTRNGRSASKRRSQTASGESAVNRTVEKAVTEQQQQRVPEGDVVLGVRATPVEAQKRNWNWFEVETPPVEEKELAARNSIDEIRSPAGERSRVADSESRKTWSLFADRAIGSFNELVNGYGGYIAQSWEVQLQPGNRRAFLVECAIPPSNSAGFFKVAQNKRMVVAAPVEDNRARGGGRAYDFGSRWSAYRADLNAEKSAGVPRITEADLANGVVRPLTNYYVQAAPRSKERRFRERYGDRSEYRVQLDFGGEGSTTTAGEMGGVTSTVRASSSSPRGEQTGPARENLRYARRGSGRGRAQEGAYVLISFVLEPDSTPIRPAEASVEVEPEK